MVTVINIMATTTSFTLPPSPKVVPNHKFQTKHGEMLFFPFSHSETSFLGFILKYLMKVFVALSAKKIIKVI